MMKRMTSSGIVFMVFILALALAGLSSVANAEGPVIDPTIAPTVTLACDMPVTREDGSALAIDDVATINFESSSDGSAWTQAGSNAQCQAVLDTTQMAEGQYYYRAYTTDTDGRVSTGRSDTVPFVVQRVAPPSPPQRLRLQ